jgi:mono/diheme cytochrome c family protein
MRKTILGCALWVCVASTVALAGDAGAGRQLAHQRCAACHIVGPGPGSEVALAPPFELIARQFTDDIDGLVGNLTGPHEKMNFRLNFQDAENIAEYMRALVK